MSLRLCAVLLVGMLLGGALVSTATAHEPADCVCPPPPICPMSNEAQQAIDEAREAVKALSNLPAAK